MTVRLKKILLCTGVAAAGASAFTLELLGFRLLAPFYGWSTFLICSLLPIMLGSYVIGTFTGWRIMNRADALGPFFLILAAAGIWILLIPWIRHPFLNLTEPLGMNKSVLMAMLLFFMPPFFLLGMVTPGALRQFGPTIRPAAATAGMLYGLHVAAGILLLAIIAPYLITVIGVNKLTVITGTLPFLAASAAWFIIGRSLYSALILALVIINGFVAGISVSDRFTDSPELRTVAQSRHSELRIIDHAGMRYLLADGRVTASADTSTWNSGLSYTAVMDLPKYFFNTKGKVLLCGLGGGSVLKQYSRERWLIEAVEPDGGIINLSRSYFGLRSSEGNVTVADPPEYLASAIGRYDIILIDHAAAGGDADKLLSSRMVSIVHRLLTDSGIVAINLTTIGWHDPLVGTVAATLRGSFARITALPTVEPPDQPGYVILLASNRDLVPLREPEHNESLDPDWRYGPGYQKVHAWDNRFVPPAEGASPFSDNTFTIGALTDPALLAIRKESHAMFGPGALDW